MKNYGVKKILSQVKGDGKAYPIYIVAYKFGNIIKIIEYERPVWKGYKGNGGRKMKDTKETSKEIREKILCKIWDNLRGLICENFDNNSRFITLTPADNVIDLSIMNYEFKKFVDRLKYRYGDFKYVAVIEFQERGAIHYHMIADLPYIEHKKLWKLWGHGFVWINKIDDVDDLGKYVLKYMNKDLDDKRLHGRKSYLRSENLKCPERYESLEVRELVEKYNLKDDEKIKFNMYETEYHGIRIEREFNIKQTEKGKKARERIEILKNEMKGEYKKVILNKNIKV